MENAGKQRSRFVTALDFLRGLLRRKPPQTPGDPYAYRMAPLRGSPKGRSVAAVAEPEQDSYPAFPPRHQ